jgi:Cytochrome P460
MKHTHFTAILVVVGFILVTSWVIAAQDRSTVKVPNGLALSEFKGYDAWQVIAPSQTDESLKAILGNAVMMKAYNEGFPSNGKAVPDGAMIAKIEWLKRSDTDSPYAVLVPDKLKSLSFMIKDATRFPDTAAWGWAQFTYDPGSNSFKPAGTGSGCGYTCHTRVKPRDYVFTGYGPR